MPAISSSQLSALIDCSIVEVLFLFWILYKQLKMKIILLFPFYLAYLVGR